MFRPPPSDQKQRRNVMSGGCLTRLTRVKCCNFRPQLSCLLSSKGTWRSTWRGSGLLVGWVKKFRHKIKRNSKAPTAGVKSQPHLSHLNPVPAEKRNRYSLLATGTLFSNQTVYVTPPFDLLPKEFAFSLLICVSPLFVLPRRPSMLHCASWEPHLPLLQHMVSTMLSV